VSGKQIKLFLVDGTPGGLSTAEITNWTGHILTAPRSDVGELLRRPEASRTGVYFLLGDDESAVGDVRCYVGEADVIGDRLKYHLREKDFWDRVAVVTSKDTNLTKSHVRYLESRLISLAQQAGRSTLDNGTAPATPPLPEADESDMDYFLQQLQIVLPVLNINVIRSRQAHESSEISPATPSPIFELVSQRAGVRATAQQVDGEFTVLEGSVVVPQWRGKGIAESTIKAYAAYRAQHEKLVANGAILVEGASARVARDIPFPSPSTAGAICLGRACNGRVEWVSAAGTFGAWESRDVS